MELYQYTALTRYDALLLLKGLGWSLLVFALSMLAGTVLGAVAAIVRQARLLVLAQLVTAAVEVFRNSPVLVQLFLVYYGLPVLVQVRLSPLTAALLTMTVNTAAFMTVIVHAALDAVPRGQWQAAMAFGLGRGQTLRHIIMPQAIRLIIPPALSLAVSQLQVTSLVSLINVVDLTKAGSILNMRTLRPFVIWPIVGAIYLALSKPLSMLAARAEARFRLRGSWTHAHGRAAAGVSP
jgi:glutamine transport system permease protein